MESEMPPTGGGDPNWLPLVDVSQRPVMRLLADGDTTLARCVDRLVRGLDDPHGVISAFDNYPSWSPEPA